jgi:hypothetical protein
MNLLKLILGNLATSSAGKPNLRPGQGIRLKPEVKGQITGAQRLLDWQRSCEQAEALAAKERDRHLNGPHRSRHVKRPA